MIAIIIIAILVIYAGVTTGSLIRKNAALIATAVVLEEAEKNIDNLLQRTYITLLTMRGLDDKHMFEEDDEVGDVFRRLADVVYEMLDVSDETHAAIGNRLKKPDESMNP